MDPCCKRKTSSHRPQFQSNNDQDLFFMKFFFLKLLKNLKNAILQKLELIKNKILQDLLFPNLCSKKKNVKNFAT